MSDVNLEWQGLSREAFDRLDESSKNFVRLRAKSFEHLKNIRLLSQVMEAVSGELGPAGKDRIKLILSGDSPEGVKFVRDVVRAYKSSGAQDMARFYNDRYRGRITHVLEAEKKRQRADIMIQPHVELTADERRQELALLVSQWEKRDPASILKSEKDALDAILKVTDENKGRGLIDSDLFLAVREMVSDSNHPAEFLLETLNEEHRPELIRRALKFKMGRER
ncbi:MAG: hypothetical protein V1921_06790 [Candidatus Altiarchaeota archaeon]